MEYYERTLSTTLTELTGQFAVVVLSGARQVGKSTLLARLFPKHRYVTFDPVQDIGNARADPDLFLSAHPTPLILDEIQYAPELVPAIKRRVDRQQVPNQYILTGSQQWAVLQSAGESLAGRAVFLDLEGFSLAELAKQPEAGWLSRYLDSPHAFVESNLQRLNLPAPVNELIFRGAMPRTLNMPLRTLRRFHESYLATYIERDIRLMADIQDAQLFGRFTQIVAALTAQEINHSQLGRELGISYKTAQTWLKMLQGTFQWYELAAYENNAIKRATGKGKGYFSDTGLACALQSISSPTALLGNPVMGAFFETAVVADIRKQMQNLAAPARMYHWRSYGGAELDLLLERDGLYYPIEIKHKSHPVKSDTRGITAWRAAHAHLRTAPGLVIAPTETKYALTESDWALPWDSM